MKSLRVFVSASDGLGEIRLAVQDLLVQLNRFFKARGFEFVPALPSEGPAGADIAVALYWKDFGPLPRPDFERAYEAFKATKSPKIYVFFKDPDAEIVDALKSFKDSFSTKYGNFCRRFETVDSVKFQLAVRSLELLPGGAADKPLAVENSDIVLGEERIASLDNLPFAKRNAKRQSLLRQIGGADREVADLEEQIRETPDNETLAEALRSARVRRCSLQEELERHEGFLFDSAVFFAKESAERMDERVREAQKLFERGKVREANKILDLDELIEKDGKDAELYRESVEVRRKSMEAFLQKAEMVSSDGTLSESERTARKHDAYEHALRIGRETFCDESLLEEIRGKLAELRQPRG